MISSCRCLTNLVTVPLYIQRLQVRATVLYRALKRVVKTLKECDSCRLATARWSHQCNSLTISNFQVETIKDESVGPGGVGELDILEFYQWKAIAIGCLLGFVG